MSYTLNATDADCYEGTFTLINKLDIRNEVQLQEVESIITTFKATELLKKPLKVDFDFLDYCNIHRELFENLYDWAGELRKIGISKKTTKFTEPEKIAELGELMFERLRRFNYFKDLSKNEFIIEIADFYNSLNMLHPFREGNGRTQRVFFVQLIRNAGHDIDYSAFYSDMLMIGCIQAASGVMDTLIDFFEQNIVF